MIKNHQVKVLNAVIVDDEANNAQLLKNLLEGYCSNVHVLGVSYSMEEALLMLKDIQPDVLFLDIDLNTATGFDLLENLEEVNFHVVITTAYEQYAIKAFKYEALDYLLKPIDLDDLQAVIEKILTKENDNREFSKLKKILVQEKANYKPKIRLSTHEGIHFVSPDEIIRCEADGAYTRFILSTGKKIIISKNLKETEFMLSNFTFFRVHQSHLINLEKIKLLTRSDGGQLEMEDGSIVPISLSKRNQFLSIFKGN
jgi:two-component system LytT family response regulator